MVDSIAIRTELKSLKRRRDQLLNTACTPHEWTQIQQKVRLINRKVSVLQQRLGWRA